jgi:hypothetical protein
VKHKQEHEEMKTLLLASAALLATAVAAGAQGETKPGDLIPDARISLGCTPQPVPGVKLDRDPSVKINLDLQVADERGNILDTPSFSALHILRSGGQADRWMQYQFDKFEFLNGHDGAGQFVFMGTLRVNPRQIIAMVVYAPPNHSNNMWFYEEYIGPSNGRLFKHLAVKASCLQEPLHNMPSSQK